MLFALTVVGRVALTPADPLDAALAAAFNDHQRRDGLLGPDAVAAASTRRARSSGRARGASAPPTPSLTAAWLDGWVAAATEQEPALAGRRRLPRPAPASSWRPASSRVIVDHADLLVLP